MLTALQAILLLAAVVNAVVGLAGGGLWWRVDPRPGWWPALRAAQVASALAAVVAAVAYASGTRPASGLFWLYVLLPFPVSFVAEQLRILSAQTVLDARGIPDAKAVGGLPDDQQRSVLRAILRRELGVMALAAIVVCFLLLRAYAQLT